MADELQFTMERVGGRLDLGEHGIDAYLAVLEHGQLTTSEIADQTSIPQPRMHDTVRSLSGHGLTELRESCLIEIVATDPDDAFANAKISLEELVEELETRYTAPARDTEAVSLIKSRSTIFCYIEEIIKAAEYELVLSLTPDPPRHFHDDLAAAIDSGVSTDLLVAPVSRVSDPEELNYLDVVTTAYTCRGITSPVFAVTDGEYSIYAAQDTLRDDRNCCSAIFNHSALSFLASGFLRTVLWNAVKTIVADGRRRSFPRRYVSIRRAVRDTREIEGDSYASVFDRDIETGNPIMIEGRVTETASEDTEETVSLHTETEKGVAEVGGLVTTLKDMEGQEILLGRDEVPNCNEIV